MRCEPIATKYANGNMDSVTPSCVHTIAEYDLGNRHRYGVHVDTLKPAPTAAPAMLSAAVCIHTCIHAHSVTTHADPT